MTLLPIKNWKLIKPAEGERYELNKVCAAPRCGHMFALEDHHIVRRSFFAGQDPWWVELDGVVVPNRVALCRSCHREITDNEAAIRYHLGQYVWQKSRRAVPLSPQPGPVGAVPGNQTEARTSPGGHSADPEPGKECPTCHRRVPHPKKKTSPVTKTFAFRVPIDDTDTFREMLDALARHVGVFEQPHWQYNAILKAIVVALQEPETTFAARDR